jgi:hypothetical protein
MELSCICCIPCRNVSKYILDIFKNLDKLDNFFKDYFEVCFYYDESRDNTLDLLNSINKKYKITVFKNRNKMLNFRTHRIANARNKMLDYVYSHDKDVKYFIMMDCDDKCKFPINDNVLEKSLKFKNWDALSFNRSGLPKNYENYDIWALQYDPFICHCFSFNDPRSMIDIMRKDITEKLNKCKKENKLFECYSAFNGFAIYKKSMFIDCKYDGKKQFYFSDDKIEIMLRVLQEKYGYKFLIKRNLNERISNTKNQVCEHINFHIDAIRKNNARIMISGDRIFDSCCLLKCHKTEMKNIILIPYRNRKYHLNYFLNFTLHLLEKYLNNLEILIIEQTNDNKLFNRGKLLNIGFDLIDEKTNCYIFNHDIDHNPKRQMVYNIYNRELDDNTILSIKSSHEKSLGGVIKFRGNLFLKMNGFRNDIWGWGSEDRDLFHRSQYHNINIIRNRCFQFKILEHKKNFSQIDKELSEKINKKFESKNDDIIKTFINESGLNNLKYKIIFVITS